MLKTAGRAVNDLLVVLCLHEVELLLDAVAVLDNCEFERRRLLLWRTLAIRTQKKNTHKTINERLSGVRRRTRRQSDTHTDRSSATRERNPWATRLKLSYSTAASSWHRFKARPFNDPQQSERAEQRARFIHSSAGCGNSPSWQQSCANDDTQTLCVNRVASRECAGRCVCVFYVLFYKFITCDTSAHV